MPPIYVKGGVWTNVEDEILKAAVSKYGLNQWARVASLLSKKSAKQAKARWSEWLNPNINKSDWTREDDERLLSLAKLLPNQWRSIAPLLGRTATHCVERYQKLLEDASGVTDKNDLSLAGPGIESLPAAGNNIGDVNINPESKPSRPDLEDMDDEDREMLSEAKARLANTQGKKAKRKARERMLEESKRISLLQKRRELKAAGIKVSLVSKNKQKRKEFDYNADIPHEHTPQAGIYDTSEELKLNDRERAKFDKLVKNDGISLKEVDDKHKREKNQELKEKRDWEKRQKQELEAAAEIFNQNEERLLKKRKLDLPEVNKEFSQQDDIDDRILNKTKELISKTNQKSTLLLNNDLPQSVSSNKPSKPKASNSKLKKSLRDFIQSSLKTLPAPKNKPSVIVPSFDPLEEPVIEETQILDVDSRYEDEGERLRNLEISRQVDEIKLQLRRSLAIQKNLSVPHPSQIQHELTSSSLLDRLIHKELIDLVNSDYTKYEDSSYPSNLIPDLDEISYDQVQAEIKEELEKPKPSHKVSPLFDNYSLPRDFETAETVISTLHSLHTTNQKLLSQLDFSSYERNVDQLVSEIVSDSHELALSAIDYNTYASIAAQEQKAMDVCLQRKHSLVDDLVQAEQQIQHRVRLLKNGTLSS